MHVSQLQLKHLRQLAELNLHFEHSVIIFEGPNGSGKTSLLEALYFLGYGRSFQSRLLQRIIRYGETNMSLFGVVQTDAELPLHIGIAKSLHEGSQIRLNGKNVLNASELVKQMPMQLIHPESFHLLSGGAQPRRQFLDWGLFHVEPEFHDLWQRSQRLLQQRNAALRHGVEDALVTLWDHSWVDLANRIDELRQSYMSQFMDLFVEVSRRFHMTLPISLHYHRGWHAEHPLQDILSQQLLNDRSRHYTYSGPHRADVSLKLAGVPVADALSRGQQKLLLMVLFLTQAELLYRRTAKRSCYLLDDVLAEFDPTKREHILSTLSTLSSQIFLTTPDISQLRPYLDVLGTHQMFHVEQGQVSLTR